MKDPQPLRGPGRPPLDARDRSVPVSFRLPARELDQVIQRASRDRVSVAEALRQAVRNSRTQK